MANFTVDPRLTSILGENYRSSELALKELIDNAWDADAENVRVYLPDPDIFSNDPIVIHDDGSGMTEKEVSQEYLAIANGRFSRNGESTPKKRRPVKGRKGVGKFAGLMVANAMHIETKARGKMTRLSIPKQAMLEARKDLEHINLSLEIEECSLDEHGTKITLTDRNQNLSFPHPEKLRKLLVLEYGRETDFHIYVNDQLLGIEDIPGQVFVEEVNLPSVGPVKLKFTVADKNITGRNSGIVMRVGGKIVGSPSFFGLDEAEDFPKKLLKRIYGEIEADGLADDVTADWGTIIESSIGFQEIQQWTEPKLRGGVGSIYKRDINLAKARWQQQLNHRLEQLPEHRRAFAKIAMERILQKFYGESDDRIETVVSVMLDTFERDEYWVVLQNIDEAKHSDVEAFAEALEQFGLLDLSVVGQQARHRLSFLDNLDEFATKSETLESIMHKALEKNLWVFGAEYSIMSSNRTLAKVIDQYTGQTFVGERAQKRPDLLLACDVINRHLLIEFKRPSHVLTRDDEAQAIKYRDDLSQMFHNKKIEIFVVGHSVDPGISPFYSTPDVKLLSYQQLISNARSQLTWLIEELKKNPSQEDARPA